MGTGPTDRPRPLCQPFGRAEFRPIAPGPDNGDGADRWGRVRPIAPGTSVDPLIVRSSSLGAGLGMKTTPL